MPMRCPTARQLGRARSALGWLSVVSLFATLCLIWTLTGQTPEETTALTKAVAFKVDDATALGGRGDAVDERDDALVGVGGASDLTGPAIISQPEPCEVREGEDVVFSVDAPGAVAYRWECTDDWTDGWYGITGVDTSESELRFELTSGRVWMSNCRFRCEVTFPGDAVLMSDEASFAYRDVMAAGCWYRNAAHVVEFGLVGLLASLSALCLVGPRCGRGGKPLLVVTVAFCAACSLVDQTHKLFVPGREFEWFDLFLDAFGYLGAIVLVFFSFRIMFGGKGAACGTHCPKGSSGS